MTPAERSLVAELFDRLAQIEAAPRDPEAEAGIKDGLRQAPNALYALVQTVLVQDEALKRADAHIRELEAELGPANEPPRQGGFLDNMRGTLFGKRDEPHAGSVPSVPPVRPGDTPTGVWGRGGDPPGSPWNRPAGGPGGNPPGSPWSQPAGGPGSNPPGGPAGYQAGGPPMGAEPMRPGGSFLGTMAASAAGMIGGSLLLGGISSMMGRRQGSASAFDQGSAGGHAASSPGSNSGDGKIAHDAGLDDIGHSPAAAGGGGDSGSDRGVGLFDSASDDAANEQDLDDDMGEGGFDDGGGGGDDGP
jgi:hypothetical protein